MPENERTTVVYKSRKVYQPSGSFIFCGFRFTKLVDWASRKLIVLVPCSTFRFGVSFEPLISWPLCKLFLQWLDYVEAISGQPSGRNYPDAVETEKQKDVSGSRKQSAPSPSANMRLCTRAASASHNSFGWCGFSDAFYLGSYGREDESLYYSIGVSILWHSHASAPVHMPTNAMLFVSRWSFQVLLLCRLRWSVTKRHDAWWEERIDHQF